MGLSEALRAALSEALARYGGGHALRCLALAYKTLPSSASRVRRPTRP